MAQKNGTFEEQREALEKRIDHTRAEKKKIDSARLSRDEAVEIIKSDIHKRAEDYIDAFRASVGTNGKRLGVIPGSQNLPLDRRVELAVGAMCFFTPEAIVEKVERINWFENTAESKVRERKSAELAAKIAADEIELETLIEQHEKAINGWIHRSAITNPSAFLRYESWQSWRADKLEQLAYVLKGVDAANGVDFNFITDLKDQIHSHEHSLRTAKLQAEERKEIEGKIANSQAKRQRYLDQIAERQKPYDADRKLYTGCLNFLRDKGVEFRLGDK